MLILLTQSCVALYILNLSLQELCGHYHELADCHAIFDSQMAMNRFLLQRFIRLLFQSLCFLSWFPWYRVTAYKEAAEPRVPNGQVEAITSKVLPRLG